MHITTLKSVSSIDAGRVLVYYRYIGRSARRSPDIIMAQGANMIEKNAKIVRKTYAVIGGQEVIVRRTSTPDIYQDKAIVYSNTLVKGKKAGQTEYYVSEADYIAPQRQTAAATKSAMLADMLAGMTVEELAKKYNIQIQ